jgi:hypothetical protein
MIKIIFPFLWVNAMTLWPFVIFNSKETANNERILNHERIHLRQQLECLLIPFYILYIIEGIFKGYRNISFEREAYDNDDNLDYLKSRKLYSFLKYFKKK